VIINYVLGFMFTPDRKRVGLIKKTKPVAQVGLWNGIGGKIESHETSLSAMVREFEEETGVATAVEDWAGSCLVLEDIHHNYTIDVFKAFSWEVERIETVTDETVRVWNVQDLFNETHGHKPVSNVKWIIPMLLDNNVYFSIIHVS
jgi:8-oxo-dGTP diphosphatase